MEAIHPMIQGSAYGLAFVALMTLLFASEDEVSFWLKLAAFLEAGLSLIGVVVAVHEIWGEGMRGTTSLVGGPWMILNIPVVIGVGWQFLNLPRLEPGSAWHYVVSMTAGSILLFACSSFI